jgi:GDP-4-dehydro-6-deoxy-D-mannose reductase
VLEVRALITGAGGFVGRHLEAHLVRCGDSVTSVDREHDVTDLASVVALFESTHPEVIYHLAALTHVGDSWTNPVEFTRVNVLGTKNVLDAARTAAPQAIVIFISSSEVYGVVPEADLPVQETYRTAPANPYSSSKLEAEHFVMEAHRNFEQHTVIARPFNHVGPGQSPQFVVPAIARRLFEARDAGRDEIAVGDLSTRRDITDVRDVVRAYRLLATYASSGEVYNVASGHDTALSDVVDWLRNAIAPSISLVTDSSLLRPSEVPVMRGSFAKIHDATGWEPEIALETSLHDVVEEIRLEERTA